MEYLLGGTLVVLLVIRRRIFAGLLRVCLLWRWRWLLFRRSHVELVGLELRIHLARIAPEVADHLVTAAEALLDCLGVRVHFLEWVNPR